MLTLWDFSLRFYSAPGVAEACLSLQDRHGVDVNLLMYAVWAGYARGAALTAEDLAAADALVREWRVAVVQPLRAVRRQLKDELFANFHADAAQLRQCVKQLELEGERLQQQRLQDDLISRIAIQVPGVDVAFGNLSAMLFFLPHDGDDCLQRFRAALQGFGDPASDREAHDAPPAVDTL